MIEVQRISDYNQFLAIHPKWEKLFIESNSTNFFLSWEWSDAYLSSQAFPQEEPWIIMVYQGTRLIGVAPLARSTIHKNNLKFSILTQIAKMQCDTGCFLMLPEIEDIFLESLFSYLAEHRHEWDFFEMNEVSLHENFGEKIKKFYPQKHILLVTRDIQHELPLKKNWDEYFIILSKKTQFNYRRYTRLLSEIGLISDKLYYKEVIPAGVMENIRDIRRHGSYPDFYDSPAYFEFISQLLTKNVPVGNAYINLTLIDDKPIAFSFGFVKAGLITFWQGTYNKAYAKFSAGFINDAATIRISMEDPKFSAENLKRGSFLRGGQNYKSVFKSEKEIYEVFRVVKPSLKTFFGILLPLYLKRMFGKNKSEFGTYKYDIYKSCKIAEE